MIFTLKLFGEHILYSIILHPSWRWKEGSDGTEVKVRTMMMRVNDEGRKAGCVSGRNMSGHKETGL